ncbi:MAG: PIN domain-containing protein [Burkholderiales bacterium]
MTRVFLDTNVLVYAFSGDDARKRGIARALVESAHAVISAQVLSELAHVLTRRLGFGASETRGRIVAIAERCEVAAVTPPIVADALRIMDKYHYAFYDSQIVAAALASGARTLYSEDMHDAQAIDGTLRIQSPFRRALEQRRAAYAVKRRRAHA